MKVQTRSLILVLVDMAIIWISILTSYLFRFDGTIPHDFTVQASWYGITSMMMCMLAMIYFKLYNRIWQYASIGELVSICKAVIIGCVLSYLIVSAFSFSRVPVSVFIRTLETTLILMGGIRFVWRVFRDKYIRQNSDLQRALIVGAGDCGTMIAKELRFNPSSQLFPVAFIDDDTTKHRQQVFGIPVLGGRGEIPDLVHRRSIDQIIIAIPSASRSEISSIIELCKLTKAKLKMIPKIQDFIEGKVSIQGIRDVDVEDLLGRDPVRTDLEGIANYVENKVVLVTGAGGSIGSELCRQIAPFQPKRLLLLGHGENSIYNIEMEMRKLFPQLSLETIIADVQHRERIEEVFSVHRPHVVFHAAAHKHVPLMEANPAEAVKNNVFGTKNVAEAADQFGVERFVLISTDKAVNPTSIMGTTKRIAEMYIQALGKTSATKFAAVRFGNVLGSRGSVIPRFKEQIAAGGPVTVTHPDMIRYFMTIPEAVQLVIQAGSYAQGGEVFILDMGKPVKILDLAQDLIRLSGFDPHHDIPIEYTGIRPGEKLFEELLTNEEGSQSTKHDRIFIGKPLNINHSELDFQIKRLEKVLNEDHAVLRDLLRHLVPSYQNVS